MSYFKLLDEAKIALSALVVASNNFLRSLMDSMIGLSRGSSRVFNKGTIAPEATTVETFSSLPIYNKKKCINLLFCSRMNDTAYVP